MDREAGENSVDIDQTPQYAAADLCLHCLPLIQHFRHINGYKNGRIPDLGQVWGYRLFTVNTVERLYLITSSAPLPQLFGPVWFQQQGVWLVFIITMFCRNPGF